MKIQLDQIGDERYDWRESVELGADLLGDGLVGVDGLVCRGAIHPTPSGLVLRADLEYVQTLQCGRCLTSWDESVSTSFDYLVEIRPEGEVEAAGEEDDEEALAGEDLGTLVLDEPTLATEPLILEQVQLGVPMKPLCREDCAGLCSQCGADLNEGPCRCEPEADPRWAALAALRPD